MARTLAALGTERAWVVHGSDGLDEVTLADKTLVGEARAGSDVRLFEIAPEDFDLERAPLETLRGGDAAENARTILSVLEGGRRGTARSLVIANAAAALHVGGAAEDLRAATRLASESIDGGAALAKLERLIEATNKPV
jgi:anthranilate phosphoribosyltransferase